MKNKHAFYKFIAQKMTKFESFCYAAFSFTLRSAEVGIYKRKKETKKNVFHFEIKKIKEKKKDYFFLF